jgi:hypothetical protein
MVRVYVVVEGPTEEQFLKLLVSPHLREKNVGLLPRILGLPGHKGGNVNLQRVMDSVYRTMMEHRSDYCTTMFDYYGLDSEFPGRKARENSSAEQKAQAVEEGLREAIIGKIEDKNRPDRFIPYVQMHEFEGLLFSDPAALADRIERSDLERSLRQIRDSFATPEDIDDDPMTAPSKRIITLFPEYEKNKVAFGTLAARKMGLSVIIDNCPHFRQWVKTLEQLG